MVSMSQRDDYSSWPLHFPLDCIKCMIFTSKLVRNILLVVDDMSHIVCHIIIFRVGKISCSIHRSIILENFILEARR